jgi:hypothetical protein
MNPIIKETANYILSAQPSIDNPEVLAYHISNKFYGVIEVQTFLLPQALKHLDDLEAALAAQTDISNQ